jgi:hypothetical protein
MTTKTLEQKRNEAIEKIELIAEQPVKKKRKSAKEPYFTMNTQRAILEYNSLDPDENKHLRDFIYEKYIHRSFDKLAENNINNYKWPYIDMQFEELKFELVAHLNEKIHMYSDPSKGNAFSYFNITLKNHLIYKNRQGYKEFLNRVDLDNVDKERSFINEVVRENRKDEVSDFVMQFSKYLDKNLANFFTNRSEMQIADAINEFFKNPENIENFNKKALYVLIREATDAPATKITGVIKKIKQLYSNCYQVYSETGNIY